MNPDLFSGKLAKNDIFSGWDDIGTHNQFHLGSKLIEKNSNKIVRGDYVNYDFSGKGMTNDHMNTFEDQEINKYQAISENMCQDLKDFDRDFDEERKKLGSKSTGYGLKAKRKHKLLQRGSTFGSKGAKGKLGDEPRPNEIRSQKISPVKARPGSRVLKKEELLGHYVDNTTIGHFVAANARPEPNSNLVIQRPGSRGVNAPVKVLQSPVPYPKPERIEAILRTPLGSSQKLERSTKIVEPQPSKPAKGADFRQLGKNFRQRSAMIPLNQTSQKKLEELFAEGEPSSKVNPTKNLQSPQSIQKKIFNSSTSSNFYKKRLEDSGLMPNYSKKYAMPDQAPVPSPEPKMVLKFAAREKT